MASFQIKGKATIVETIYTTSNVEAVPTYKQAGTVINLSPRTGPSLEATTTGYSISGTDLGQTYCVTYVEYTGNVASTPTSTPTAYSLPITSGKYSSIKIVMCGGGAGGCGGGGNGTRNVGQQRFTNQGGSGGNGGDGGIYVSATDIPIPSTTTTISVQVGSGGRLGGMGANRPGPSSGAGTPGTAGTSGSSSIVSVGATVVATANGGNAGNAGTGGATTTSGTPGNNGGNGSPGDSNTATYNNALSVTGPAGTVQKIPVGSYYCKGGRGGSNINAVTSLNGYPGYVRIYLYV
jgi:hypothetical protein